MKLVSEALEKYVDAHMRRVDNSKALTQIVEAIGYRRDGFGEAIENFLNDNPGACEALYEWIGNQRCDEWTEQLTDSNGNDEE